MKAPSLNGSAKAQRPNGHAHEAECTCPTCGTLIPEALHTAILGRQRAAALEIEKTVGAKFVQQIAEANTRKKSEIDAAVKTATKAVEAKLKLVRDHQAGVVTAAVQVERERSEKAVAEAIATAALEHATEKTRLELNLADALRKLQAKAPHQLGEPVEAALFEALSGAFGSGVSRIAKGRNGPDLVIEIFDGGSTGDISDTPIGRIAVEAKNVSNWSSRFIPKLKSDARALNAEPILVSNVFPRGAERGGVCVVDGVVVCAFPFAVPLIELLRKQIIETHRLRLTGKARNQKGAALLGFVGSAACAELLRSFVTIQDRLQDTDQKEQSAHATVWRKRGELIKSLQQAHQDLVSAFDTILAGPRREVSEASA